MNREVKVTHAIVTEDDYQFCNNHYTDNPCEWLDYKCNLFNSPLHERKDGKVRRCKKCREADTMPNSPMLK